MRAIQISTDVFAALWAERKEGEPDEDAILRRILKVKASPAESSSEPVFTGFYDSRHRVAFRPGFVIFRTYLGKEYRATAGGGMWILASTGKGYMSLNELSRAVIGPDKKENAWAAWFYKDDKGRRVPISGLRDQNTISRRTRPELTLEDLNL